MWLLGSILGWMNSHSLMAAAPRWGSQALCSWIDFHGPFFFFTVPFNRVLCYNIKLTDYAILGNDLHENEPGIDCIES